MAQPYVTGPVLIYVGVGGITNAIQNRSGLPLFLGTGRVAPESRIIPEWEPLMNDLGGTRIPFDMVYEGEHAMTVVDLTRWNESVLAQIQARPTHDGSQRRGRSNFGDVGTLMVHEGRAYDLFLRYPNSTKPAYNGGGGALGNGGAMPPGIRFFASWLEGPDTRRTGTRASEMNLIWHSIRAFTPTTRRLDLYDDTATSMALIADTNFN